MEQLTEFISAEPLGIAVLISVVLGFYTGKVVRGAELERSNERADRLAQTVDTLAEAVSKATEAAEKSLDATRLVHSLIQGIDSTLRNHRGP